MNFLDLRKKYCLGNSDGFSFLELMFSLLIFSVVMSAIFGALAIAKISGSSNIVDITLQQKARQATDFMLKEIREGSNISISGGGSQIDFSVSGIGSICYKLEGSQITRTNGAGGSPDGRGIVLIDNVSGLLFSQTNPVNINISMQKNTYLNYQRSFSLVGKATVRN